MPEVEARTGLSARTIRRLVAKDDFPPPIRLSHRTVGWLESEVDAWILERAARSRDGPARDLRSAVSRDLAPASGMRGPVVRRRRAVSERLRTPVGHLDGVRTNRPPPQPARARNGGRSPSPAPPTHPPPARSLHLAAKCSPDLPAVPLVERRDGSVRSSDGCAASRTTA